MMKIAIIEDEPLAANNLKRFIKKYDVETEIYPIADSVEQAVLLLKDVRPDLIFLDIELADGSSFQIFDQVEIKSPIIFTTAYDEYALKAFEVNSVAYLLKPITEEKIENAFHKLGKLKSSFSIKSINKAVGEIQKGSDLYKRSFLVKKANKLLPIGTEEIAYFFADGKWVYLVSHQNNQFIVNYTLGDLEEQLNPSHFFRVNRKYLVSREAIDYLEPYFKGQVCAFLKPPVEKLVVSRKTTPELKDWLSK